MHHTSTLKKDTQTKEHTNSPGSQMCFWVRVQIHLTLLRQTRWLERSIFEPYAVLGLMSWGSCPLQLAWVVYRWPLNCVPWLTWEQLWDKDITDRLLCPLV